MSEFKIGDRVKTSRLASWSGRPRRQPPTTTSEESQKPVPVWHETWEAVGDMVMMPDFGPERVRLMAAAPDLARALLAVEEEMSRVESYCYVCGTLTCEGKVAAHAPDCILDAALKRAGVR